MARAKKESYSLEMSLFRRNSGDRWEDASPRFHLPEAWSIRLRPAGPVNILVRDQVLDVHDVRIGGEPIRDAVQVTVDVRGLNVTSVVKFAGWPQAVADAVNVRCAHIWILPQDGAISIEIALP